MSRAGRKRKVKNIYEEPKNVLEMPVASPFAQLRQGELLDRGIKSVKLGKERISGKRIKEALMNGIKIKMDGVEINPQHLPVRHTGNAQDTSTALLRLKARKHITEGNFIAGESLQRLYWAGFGEPNPSVREYGKPAGGTYDPIQFVCMDSQRFAVEVLEKFEKKVTKWVYASVMNIVAHDRDPPWVYGKLTTADKYEISIIQTGFKELSRAFRK